MTDVSLDEDFDVHLDDRNDVAIVNERAEFEQSVAIKLTSFMYDIAGDSDLDTIKERIRLQVSRVARNHDLLDSIRKPIRIERDADNPGTVNVEIVYISSENFDFNLNL